MLNINDYQSKVYEALSTNVEASVFDEVPVDSNSPLCVIGDYEMTDGITKDSDYTIKQKFDIYSDYEGKKEINDLVSKLIKTILELNNQDLKDGWFITGVSLSDCNVYRSSEKIYIANINMNINIARC